MSDKTTISSRVGANGFFQDERKAQSRSEDYS